MLLLGPPVTAIDALPLTSRECAHTGFRTMIGMGTLASTNAQVARARTSEVRLPVRSEAKVSGTRSVTSACKYGTGASDVGGTMEAGGGLVTVPGKLMATSFDSVSATSPAPL